METSSAALESHIGIFPRHCGVDSASVNVVSLPTFHIGGIGITLATHLMGGANYMMREFEPRAFVDLLESVRCTHTGMVRCRATG